MINIYVCKYDEQYEDILLDKMSLLSYSDKERIEKYRFSKDRIMSFMGLAMFYAFCDTKKKNGTVTVLKDYSFITKEIFEKNIVVEVEKNGKPEVKNNDSLFFNISHSGEYTVLAVSDKPVGIDVQEYKNINKRIADRFFNKKDSEYLDKFEDDEYMKKTIEVWTAKEAYVKMLGKGIGEGLDGFYEDFEEGIIIDALKEDIKAVICPVKFDEKYACFWCAEQYS